MLTVEDWAEIRRLCRAEQMSISEVARVLGVSRNTCGARWCRARRLSTSARPRGRSWMGSNRGISRVSRRELNDFAEGRRGSITAVVFGTKDGLKSAEINGGAQPSGVKASDGRLWFPTMAGVAVVDPAAVAA